MGRVQKGQIRPEPGQPGSVRLMFSGQNQNFPSEVNKVEIIFLFNSSEQLEGLMVRNQAGFCLCGHGMSSFLLLYPLSSSFVLLRPPSTSSVLPRSPSSSFILPHSPLSSSILLCPPSYSFVLLWNVLPVALSLQFFFV